jgi:hypothetical protein
MPRGLNGTHRELSLTGAVASDIWRPPALQAREDPNTNGEYGSVRFISRTPPAFAGLIAASRLASYSHLPFLRASRAKGRTVLALAEGRAAICGARAQHIEA